MVKSDEGGRGWVQTAPLRDDIIYEQPLTYREERVTPINLSINADWLQNQSWFFFPSITAYSAQALESIKPIWKQI